MTEDVQAILFPINNSEETVCHLSKEMTTEQIVSSPDRMWEREREKKVTLEQREYEKKVAKKSNKTVKMKVKKKHTACCLLWSGEYMKWI